MLTREWRTATRSGTDGNCVEVRRADDGVQVRDTKNREGGTLTVPSAGWQTFINDIKAGELDLS